MFGVCQNSLTILSNKLPGEYQCRISRGQKPARHPKERQYPLPWHHPSSPAPTPAGRAPQQAPAPCLSSHTGLSSSSRYLYPTGIHIIVGHVRIFPLQRLELPTRHDGVHKKTTRIAQHLRVGQLALTNINYHFPYNRKRQCRIFFKLLTNGSII